MKIFIVITKLIKILNLSFFSLLISGCVVSTPIVSNGTGHDYTRGNDKGNKKASKPLSEGEYTFVDLGPTSYKFTYVTDINNNNTILGYMVQRAKESAFIYQNGRLEKLFSSNTKNLRGVASNESGQLLISDFSTKNKNKSFLSSNGNVVEICHTDHHSSYPADINNEGQVICRIAEIDTHILHSYLLSNGEYLSIVGAHGNSTSAVSINEKGQVVGYSGFNRFQDYQWKAFLYTGGKTTSLGTLGGNISKAFDINDQGQIVGYATTISNQKCAFLFEHGKMKKIGGSGTEAKSINNKGQIVGNAYVSNRLVPRTRAIIFRQGSVVDLNTIEISNKSDWILATADEINENGWIVGMAHRGGQFDYDEHAYVLIPNR